MQKAGGGDGKKEIRIVLSRSTREKRRERLNKINKKN